MKRLKVIITLGRMIMCLTIFADQGSCILMRDEGRPIVKEAGRAQEIVLDCPYELERGNEDGLVITWYYNDLVNLVYQWIPLRPPQAMGLLKGKVDLSYESSDREYYRHKAIRIVFPSTNMTGRFICKVSSFNDEKLYSLQLVVFSVPSKFRMNIELVDEDSIKVECHAASVFPEPRIHLFRALHSKRVPLTDGRLYATWTRGSYDISIEANVKEVQLDGLTQFECHLNIPQTAVSMERVIKYMPRNLPIYHPHYSSSSAIAPTCTKVYDRNIELSFYLPIVMLLSRIFDWCLFVL